MPASRTGRAPSPWRTTAAFPLALTLLLFAAPPVHARLDLDDRGPILRAGDFNLRVSNAGILGNPFPERSLDPSFEYPKGSGQQLMHYAALWVGALDRTGQPHVSGGPLLEWRPSTAPGDTVHEAWHGRLGSRHGVDDDRDLRIDEELLNGRDDDGDGEVDEDLGLAGQQMLAADFVDDRPEAIAYLYPGYERHTPLGLSVHQETYAWSWPGHRGIAGLQYAITNHGTELLRDVYVGLYVDFDLRPFPDLTGDLADDVQPLPIRVGIPKGFFSIEAGTETHTRACVSEIRQVLPVLRDPVVPGLPVVTVLPLEHSIDTLAFAYGRPQLPRRRFSISLFASDRPSEAGGTPRLDSERYAALAGNWTQSPSTFRGDQAVLVSFGPFPEMLPGETIRFAAALVAAPQLDSLAAAIGRAAVVHEGRERNLMPDYQGPRPNWFTFGESGINGHDACIEPPAGVSFTADPDCASHIPAVEPIPPIPQTYVPGTCIWTDTDCDKCTGNNGNETVFRWMDPRLVPPPPGFRAVAGDHGVRIEWDNLSEILLEAGVAGPEQGRFVGYNVYKLADWRGRGSLMPSDERWALLGSYGFDEEDGRRLLAGVTDTTLDYVRIWYEQPLYPVGRYGFTDPDVINGFDYAYVVTAVVEVRTEHPFHVDVEHFESPVGAMFTERVTPRSEASASGAQPWVVPNPFRAHADWDRPPVAADPLTRHLDFMGLPRARCTIRIWTVAGDLVASFDHDGSGGNGQAAWDLVSRNGQEVSSGVYVFTVDSPLGQSTGRFVVIR